jgi:hypothetical protein
MMIDSGSAGIMGDNGNVSEMQVLWKYVTLRNQVTQSCHKTVTRNNCMRCFYLLFSQHVLAYTMAILKQFL